MIRHTVMQKSSENVNWQLSEQFFSYILTV